MYRELLEAGLSESEYKVDGFMTVLTVRKIEHNAIQKQKNDKNSPTWHVSNILTAIMGTSVPLFFMISGALLLDSKKTLSIGLTLKNRLYKFFIPFLVWSMIAILYFEGVQFATTGDINTHLILTKLRNIPSQPTTVHLWFMYALIPLYILSPLLKRLVNTITKELAIYLLSLWVVFSSILPTIVMLAPQKFQSLFILNPAYNLNFMNGYLGYFIAGYYVFIYEKRVSKKHPCFFWSVLTT